MPWDLERLTRDEAQGFIDWLAHQADQQKKARLRR